MGPLATGQHKRIQSLLVDSRLHQQKMIRLPWSDWRVHRKFAVRGGGHMWWTEASNIQDGVTIDLGSLKQVEISTDRKITSVGGGARWEDVYLKLDAMNLAVVGGRVADVGVGGLTLGGKIFNSSASHQSNNDL